MKSYIALATLGLMLSASSAHAEKVLATVNGQQITQSEVDKFYDNSPARMQGLPKEMIQPAIVDQLITMVLIDEQVKAAKIAETAKVKERVEELRIQILRDVWLEEQVNKELSPEKVKARYDEIIKELSGEEEVKASHILLDTQDQAKEVIAELEKGADFKKLAETKSIGPSSKDGGSLGYFTKGAMVPSFSEAAFATPVGSFTKEPVQTQFGWHVILVEDKKKIDPPSFADIEERIKIEVSRDILSKIIDDLQAKAKIERADAPAETQKN